MTLIVPQRSVLPLRATIGYPGVCSFFNLCCNQPLTRKLKIRIDIRGGGRFQNLKHK